MKPGNVLINCSLVAVSLFLGPLLLEAGARVVWSEKKVGSCTIEDENLLYKYGPNCEFKWKKFESELVTYRFNACGYRGHSVCGLRGADSFRIFVVGDSFTMGALVAEPDLYVSVAEAHWNEQLPYHVEVLNAGVQGYDLYQYSVRMNEAFDHEADLILVGLLPNDLFPDISESAIAGRQALAATVGVQATHERTLATGQHPSGPWTTLRRLRKRSRFSQVVDHIQLSNDNILLRNLLEEFDRHDYWKSEPPERWLEKFEHARSIIGAMAATAEERGVKLAFVLIPQLQQAILVKNKNVDERFDPFIFSQMIGEITDEFGLLTIDFLDYLEDHPRPSELYYPADQHMTPAGQRLLGAFVANSLIERGVFPADLRDQGISQ